MLFDRVRTRVAMRFPEEPLPWGLEISLLDSYLEQRFGTALEGLAPPLPRSSGAVRWFFPPPDGRWKESVIAALPMIVDPRSHEAIDLTRIWNDLPKLARDRGWKLTPDELARRTLAWLGPLHNLEHLRQQANQAAARASRAWLLAAGLAAETEAIRAQQGKPAVPAPGLSGLCETGAQAAKAASAEADAAAELLCEVASRGREVMEGGKDTSVGEAVYHLRERELLAVDRCGRVLAEAKRAERAARSVAQLAFGVSAARASDERIERLDRAGVAVLYPPHGYGPPVSLLDDGVTLRSDDHQELLIEIAGILCRLLLDRHANVSFDVPGDLGGAVMVGVLPGDVLAATSRPHRARTVARAMKKLGWRQPKGRAHRREWPSPVRAIQPLGAREN